MKLRLSCGLVAAVLAATIVVAPARPAQANAWVNIAVAVATSLFSGSGSGSADLERAKQEILAAVNSAKQEILNHIDAIAAADVRACTEAAVTKYQDIDSMPDYLLGPFVNGAVDCAFLSTAYFDAVQDLRAADNIGKLMGIIYSIAMASYTKFGLSVTHLLDRLITGYDAVVARLTPTNCTIKRLKEPGFPPDRWWECTAYNGDVGTSEWCTGQQCQPNRAQAENRATRNTSRPTALEALPTLRQLRA
ncbi:hypothetical protein WEI85_12815 [Actinomycetes bacterium KLBMP 9797]